MSLVNGHGVQCTKVSKDLGKSQNKITLLKDELLESCKGEVTVCHEYDAFHMKNEAL